MPSLGKFLRRLFTSVGLNDSLIDAAERGADPHARGDEALRWAYENHHPDTAALIATPCARQDSKHPEAASQAAPEVDLWSEDYTRRIRERYGLAEAFFTEGDVRTVGARRLRIYGREYLKRL